MSRLTFLAPFSRAPIELKPSKPSAPRRLHPLALRITHWINATAIFIMIGSGWKIYNDDIIFGFLRFPDSIVIGKWAQYGLQWHFFGMWIFVLNGLALSLLRHFQRAFQTEAVSNQAARSLRDSWRGASI
jgi:thiosulfate reductase cytochrome b subunit